VAVPSVGRMREVHVGAWSGVWMEKQGLGFFAGHFAMIGVALAMFGRRNWPWLLAVPLAGVLILGATGRSAMLMAFLGVAVLVWARMLQMGPRLAIASSWLGLVGASIAFLGVFYLSDEILGFLGRSSDITGRAELWEALDYLIAIDPVKGLGYQGFWRQEDVLSSPYQWLEQFAGFKAANAHSSWLDTQAQLGLVGLALLVACVGMAWAVCFIKLPSGWPASPP
jgi:exopolysaccharide production protein ExoQ